MLALFCFAFFVVLIGCGGSGGGGGQVVGTTASTNTGGDTGGNTDGGGGVVGTGRVLVVIDWPAFTREIPDYAKSVVLRISLPGTSNPIATKVQDRTSNEPHAHPVEFLDIPAQDVVLECRAMTEAQGKGEVVGKFLTNLKVVTNGETSLLATINGTVKSVHASNAPDTLEVGKGVMLLAHGVDDEGKTLMLPAQAIKWTMVSGSEYAELLVGGSLVGLEQGECVIRVTETSSGDTDEFTVNIIPSSSTTGGSGGSTGGTTGGGGGSPNLTGAKFALVRHNLGQASSLYVEDVMSGSTFEVINTSSPLLRDPGDVPGESLIIANPRITENGQSIIFMRLHFDGLNGLRNWDIYSVGTNGTNLKKIKADRELRFVNKTGTAFITKDPFSSNVFLMLGDGTETAIPHPGTPVPYVDWSEDGGSLLTQRFSVFNSRRVAVPSGQVVQTYGFSSAPPYRFNKDLTKLLTFGQGADNNFVEIIDVATGSKTLLDTWAEDRFFTGDVNFTPDHKGVIRYQSTGTHVQLYVIGFDGSKSLLRQDPYPVPLSHDWSPVRYLWQPGYGSRP